MQSFIKTSMPYQRKKSKTANIVFQVVIWSLLYLFITFSFPGPKELIPSTEKYANSLIFILLFAFLFYFNYYFLINKFIYNRKLWAFVICNFLLILLFSWLNEFLRYQLFNPPRELFPLPRPDNKTFQFRGLIFIRMMSPLILSVLMSLSIKITNQYFKSEAERRENENIKLLNELSHLKYQLQPHFFFNSLNNIYSLVDISPEKAKETIHSLGKLMRYLLYETNADKVKLSHEMEFIKRYIKLMEIRLPKEVITKYDFSEIDDELYIAPLLLIPLIENAYKHGVSSDQPSMIRFELKVSNSELEFTSINTNFPKKENDKSGSGIGLDNLQKRLGLLYNEKYSLDSKIDNDLYISHLVIQLN
jgi:hypothetical protein